MFTFSTWVRQLNNESLQTNVCEKQVKARLALEAVANAENFAVEEADLDAEIEKIAKAYGMEKDVLKSALRPEDTENITKDIKGTEGCSV